MSEHVDDRVASRVRKRVRVEGIVQGVGYRPFVHALAARSGLAGLVGNDARGVFLEVEGEPADVDRFVLALEREAPPLAAVERVSTEDVPPLGEDTFVIVHSAPGGRRDTLISPDTATCADCLAEMADPADRRFGYPFLNCTNCGPRFTIVRDVPYDRPNTTMAGFAMCAACAAEYADPSDRRFHAQPVCCPACGPSLSLLDAGQHPIAGEPVAATVALLRAGKVVAVKGLGGYHLAALAGDESAVAALRRRKHREDKPFAVMVADVAAARTLCATDAAEEALLVSSRRPAVLLRRRLGAPVAASVAPGNHHLGVMLPYTPLHHLLARELGEPFVLTSGNVSDEPIAYRDADAGERLSPIADAFLVHDRPIHIRTDDSVTRAFRGREMLIRRSRGYVPQPLTLPAPAPRPILGCGAELKNTFCLARGRHAFVSHHIGDLENYETLRSFMDGIAHFSRLFDIAPEVVAHDLHPEYLSTKYAVELDDVELIGVQHHHAHIASCLADNAQRGPVIGVAFDGLGYGTDGSLWGGEVLVCDYVRFERAAHLAAVPMPGGVRAITEPWRMAAAYLDAAGLAPEEHEVARRNHERWADVLAVARSGVQAPPTSSAGRLFDAVSALLGVRDRVNYEGQAAVELEQHADPGEQGVYPVTVDDGQPLRIRGTDLIRGVVDDHRRGVPLEVVAARFHNSLAATAGDVCAAVRDRTGIGTVALSGGVWQNRRLLGATVDLLEARGFAVLVHRQVPTNDGGISLGQVAVAAARAGGGG
ncbi:MAG TPA: carbamoyltransferase HypF [Egibacteraceae bacterium]|nr:carbamoyltransferase HypF [Egibacteraceae bacterium]